MSIRISAVREIEDPRTEVASGQPHRRNLTDPLDPRAECPLGRLRIKRVITEAEYHAGCRWRTIYLRWLRSIEAPNQFPSAIDNSLFAAGAYILPMIELTSDDNPDDGFRRGGVSTIFTSAETDLMEEMAARTFKEWDAVLMKCGRGIRDAVNAVAVYEEPEELGDFDRTSKAAKIGLAALARHFG